MACACGGGGQNRPQFEVVAANGRTVFTSHSKMTADTVSQRYPGSEVRQQGKTAPAPAAPTTPVSAPAKTPGD